MYNEFSLFFKYNLYLFCFIQVAGKKGDRHWDQNHAAWFACLSRCSSFDKILFTQFSKLKMIQSAVMLGTECSKYLSSTFKMHHSRETHHEHLPWRAKASFSENALAKILPAVSNFSQFFWVITISLVGKCTFTCMKQITIQMLSIKAISLQEVSLLVPILIK